jgi:hypothetical protein
MEHDPSLCEHAQEMTEYVSQPRGRPPRRRQCCSTIRGPTLPGGSSQERYGVFYFDEGPRAETRIVAKSVPRTRRIQTTLEAFS